MQLQLDNNVQLLVPKTAQKTHKHTSALMLACGSAKKSEITMAASCSTALQCFSDSYSYKTIAIVLLL